MDKKVGKKLLRIIKKYDVITIYGHINPDCDCYGSSMGLREILRANFPKKEIYALGFGPEYVFEQFPKYDVVSDETIKKSLAIIVDVSELVRVSEQRIYLAKKMIKIDHHITYNSFDGLYDWTDTSYVACAQMIADFAFTMGLKIPKIAAKSLYLGILTDSGRFRYAPTDGETFRTVGKLLDIGVDTQPIFDMLYQSEAMRVKYQAHIINSFKTTKHGVIYAFMDEKDYTPFGFEFDEISKNVSVLGNIKGCPIWALFTRSPEGAIRVELRSKDINIEPIAKKHGGGGHAHASGIRIPPEKGWPDAKLVVAELDELARLNR